MKVQKKAVKSKENTRQIVFKAAVWKRVVFL